MYVLYMYMYLYIYTVIHIFNLFVNKQIKL